MIRQARAEEVECVRDVVFAAYPPLRGAHRNRPGPMLDDYARASRMARHG